MNNLQVALELYTVRDETRHDFAGTLQHVAHIGYAGVEFAGYGNLNSKEMSALLAETRLKAVSTHLGLDALEGPQLDASIRYDAVVDAAVSLAGEMKYQTLEALGEAIAIGLLRRFALIDTICVGVSKFSPPIPHTLRKVGIAVRLARSDLADWPTAEALEAFA